jgi:hypothetical protein
MSMVAVGIGGAVIVAGGAVAAGAMQSNAASKANASSSAATKKYMKLSSKEAESGYGDMMKAVKGLEGAQRANSSAYMSRMDNVLASYNRDTNNAIGGGKWEKRWVPGQKVPKEVKKTITTGKGRNKKKKTVTVTEYVEEGGKWEDVYVPDKSYTEGVQEVVDEAKQNTADFETRSDTILEDSADQAYDYNLSRFDDFNNFARRISEENQKIRLDLARAATPLFDETRSQIALNDLQLTQGIVPASVQAEIERNSAQRALGSGVGTGSQLKNNLSMRDLGLSSYAGIQQGQQNFRDRQLLDYNTLVAGTQMGVNDVYNFMGLNVNKAIDINNENSAKLFDAQKVGLDYKMVGLNATLNARTNLLANMASMKQATFSNVYGQESDTARTAAGMKAGAAEFRTNAMLGIQGQGLAGAYANANRTYNSGMVNAQLVGNTTSQIGGSMMGAGLSSMSGGGGAGGAGGGGYGDRNAYLAGLGGGSGSTATDTAASWRRV